MMRFPVFQAGSRRRRDVRRPTGSVTYLTAGKNSQSIRGRLSGVVETTLIAAEQTGRKAFLLELDPLYGDVIVQRYEQFTGQKAARTAHA
jgi:hypothetical protein